MGMFLYWKNKDTNQPALHPVRLKIHVSCLSLCLTYNVWKILLVLSCSSSICNFVYDYVYMYSTHILWILEINWKTDL